MQTQKAMQKVETKSKLKRAVAILFFYFKNYRKSTLFLIAIFVYLVLPLPTFTYPTSTIVLDKNGELLAAQIAKDGQWRFSAEEKIPTKFETCLLQFEDNGFYHHWGISIKAIGRALKQNITKNKVVSGASTITMQTIRIGRHNRKRSFTEKIYEMILATKMEFFHRKIFILNTYCSNAPFGNNVVGLSAASWRYYAKPPSQLSWAESATLAVLPNAPSLIYPGKNQQKLLSKRNRLLLKLLNNKKIDSTTYYLSLAEPLPCKPLPLPQQSTQLLQKIIKEGSQGKTITTTIDHSIQNTTTQLLQQHLTSLRPNNFDGAIIIANTKTGELVAYLGNSNQNKNTKYVDFANAYRSSGSILKPLLYASSIDNATISPRQLLADIPANFGNYNPNNYNKTFEGAVPANEALARSLNIPMINLLKDYGVQNFKQQLIRLNFEGIKKRNTNYGLTLIIGGAEVSLYEVVNAYTHMASQLQTDTIFNISLTKSKHTTTKKIISNASIYQTLEAISGMNRPDELGNWKMFENKEKIAWKTGTSYGNRDAWCVGITPNYVVGVWIGNADGTASNSLVGFKAAAPLLFTIMNQLPSSKKWFDIPKKEMDSILICKASGFLANTNCSETEKCFLPTASINATACPYHQLIAIDKNTNQRVNMNATAIDNMQLKSYFVLPPLMEKYFISNHVDYEQVPKFAEGVGQIKSSIEVLYPLQNQNIIVGINNKFIATAHATSAVFWHLDNQFLGTTSHFHEKEIATSKGKHTLNISDTYGSSKDIIFFVK